MSVTREYANIPSAQLRDLGNRLKEIHITVQRLQEEARDIRDKAAKHLGLGAYETMTVYTVSETWVKRHHRDGYKAVRVRTGLSKKGVTQKS